MHNKDDTQTYSDELSNVHSIINCKLGNNCGD